MTVFTVVTWQSYRDEEDDEFVAKGFAGSAELHGHLEDICTVLLFCAFVK